MSTSLVLWANALDEETEKLQAKVRLTRGLERATLLPPRGHEFGRAAFLSPRRTTAASLIKASELWERVYHASPYSFPFRGSMRESSDRCRPACPAAAHATSPRP